ncbi:MAG: phosphoribosyl-ATP pyrophosphohydrolase [delta proteobacterium ML8_F1]|nr:MAG: phosphoribosyl-ATP pyrophosphohydrolase [delta proteobacterium ML8_F1]
MIVYNKLVRDKIPQIIADANKEFKTHIVDREEAVRYLLDKFDEEIEEFKEAYAKEELADILELVHGLAYQLNYDLEEIEAIRAQKYENRGGFEARIILDHVLE